MKRGFASKLASPLAVLIAVPGLVALVGLVLTASGDRALRGSNLEAAQDRISDQTSLVASSVRRTLSQCDPMLERLAVFVRSHDPNRPFETFAHVLADLMQGRPGVKFASASFPDGTFQGADVQSDGVIRFQDSRIGPEGTHVRFFELGRRGELRRAGEEFSGYDPRARVFYRLALERQGRVWTPPYQFFGTNYTGVTRAEAVYAGDGAERQLHAVVTVDFDVTTLSTYLADLQLPGTRALLYDANGAVLAYSGAHGADISPPPRDRILRYADIRDPVVSRFFESAERPKRPGPPFGELIVGGEHFLTSVASVSDDATLGWFVAYVVPTSQFLSAAHTYENRSLLFGALALSVATLAGWLFARNIVLARRETAEAQADARDARGKARQLGQYRLEEKLGEGGMGVVYRASHVLLRRPTAIKLLAAQQVGEKALERFAREVRQTARLTHPNTVTVYDYGHTPEGTFYYAMELLDGIDLELLVRRSGPMPAARARHVLLQISGALSEAHALGLIHRDVKPSNIMLCEQPVRHEVAKLLDFGLVKDLRDLGRDEGSSALVTSADGLPGAAEDPDRTTTGPRFVSGSPLYMAPEAIGRPDEVGPSSDLYSVGAVGYFLLVGAPVFDARTIGDICDQHLHRAPLPPSVRLGLPVPAGLERVILRCLQKKPRDRPSSASALADELAALEDVGEWTPRDAQDWWKTHDRGRLGLPTGEPEATLPTSEPGVLGSGPSVLTVSLRNRS